MTKIVDISDIRIQWPTDVTNAVNEAFAKWGMEVDSVQIVGRESDKIKFFVIMKDVGLPKQD